MKIAHIIPAYIPARRYGGPAVSVHGLCRSLVSRGHEVHVFTTNWNVSRPCDILVGAEVITDGVKIHYFSVPFWGRRLYYAPELEAYLNRNASEFDIIHVHTSFSWTPWVGAKIARRHRIPYIVSPRGMLIAEMVNKKNRFLKKGWIYLADRQNLEQASAIHFTTSMEEQRTRRLSLRLPKGFVVPNGLDPDIASAAADNLKTAPSDLKDKVARIVFLSRINWKKGLDRLIPALKHVANAELVIAGNDDENHTKTLKELAIRLGMASRLTFVGPVYGDDKVKLLETADLFVLPSYSENFGNAVLEAMALGRPVIVTPEVGLSEVIKAKNAGLVVEGHPPLLGRAINDLLKDKVLRAKLGDNAAKLALSEFHPLKIAGLMEEQYRRILDNAYSRN